MKENSHLNEKSVVRYSLALYKVAKEQGIEKPLEIDASLIIEKYNNDKKFGLLLTSPLLSPKNQTEVVNSLFSSSKTTRIKIHKVMFAFIMLLASKNRLNIMKNCLDKFISMIVSENKELKVNITTVKTIDDSLKKKIIEIFSKKTKRRVNISNIVEKDILGGIIIEMGSNLIDVSIRNKISKINQVIKGVN